MNKKLSPIQIIALILTLALGAAIRLYDLTDPPLDFHPTRQILSLNKARGMYYETLTDAPAEERAFAIQQWKLGASVEPAFFERIVAFTYQFTGVEIWVARIYSSIFWIVGAIFIFLLIHRFTSYNAALASTAFYLFLPYAVFASRAFQPDPLMVMLVLIFWYAAYCWGEDSNSYKWAIVAGLFGGFAIFIKLSAAFFVLGGGLGVAFVNYSLKELIRKPQVYLMGALGIFPGLAYIIYGTYIAGYLGQQFGGRNIPALYFSPAYYLGWMGILNLVMGGIPIMLGLFGFYFLRDKLPIRFLSGIWLGYAFFGIYFNYHISTHDYYSLLLIPIVAISLAPLFDSLITSLRQTPLYQRVKYLAVLVVLIGLTLSLWNTRSIMKSNDYREEPAKWIEISRTVGKDARLVGLVEDYGARMSYWGWRSISAFPQHGDIYYHENRGAQFDFETLFAEQTAKRDYFIVTDFDELEKQPFLKAYLNENYDVAFSGDGYLIYDLNAPVK